MSQFSATIKCNDCGMVVLAFESIRSDVPEACELMRSGLGALAALPDLGSRLDHPCTPKAEVAPSPALELSDRMIVPSDLHVLAKKNDGQEHFGKKFVRAVLARPGMYGVESAFEFELVINGYLSAIPGHSRTWREFVKFVQTELDVGRAASPFYKNDSLDLDTVKSFWKRWLEEWEAIPERDERDEPPPRQRAAEPDGPMGPAGALAETKARWGAGGQIMANPAAKKSEHRYWVGDRERPDINVGYGPGWYGRGATWEEAFDSATRNGAPTRPSGKVG